MLKTELLDLTDWWKASEDLDMKKNIECMISFGGKERERAPSRVDTW